MSLLVLVAVNKANYGVGSQVLRIVKEGFNDIFTALSRVSDGKMLCSSSISLLLISWEEKTILVLRMKSMLPSFLCARYASYAVYDTAPRRETL